MFTGLRSCCRLFCCWLWLTGRRVTAGTGGGALLALKGYGVPLIALSILRRDWRFAGAAAGSVSVIAILAGALLGFHQWVDFVATHTASLFSGVPTPALQTLKSFLSLALHLPTMQSGTLQILTPSSDRLLFCLQAILLAALLLWLSEFRLFRKQAGAIAVPP